MNVRTNQSDPTSADGVDTNTRFLAIAAGDSHTCALKPNGNAQCWGNNRQKQAPRLTRGPFVAIAAGVPHSCALKTNGDAQCWGGDEGASIVDELTPNSPYVAIAAGDNHNCAIKFNGEAECWGSDSNDQATVPDGFTARTDPDVVWLGEKTQFIGGIPIKVKVYLEGALP